MDSTAPSFLEQQRLEEALREMLRRTLREIRGVEPTGDELESLVRAEFVTLTRDFGDAFWSRLADSVEKSNSIQRKDTVAPQQTWLTEPQLIEAQKMLWYAKLQGIDSIPDALTWFTNHRHIVQQAPNLRACVEEFQIQKRCERVTALTVAGYRHRLSPFTNVFGDRQPGTITPKDITGYLARWPNSTNRHAHWQTLSTFFGFLLRRRYIHENIVLLAVPRSIPHQRRRLIFTPQEAILILRETKHTDEIGFWVLSLFAGLSGQEIVRLSRHPAPWRVIRLSEGIIDLREEESPRCQRVIAILPNLHSWLVWMKAERRPLFSKNHWEKARLIRAKIMAYRNKRLNAAKTRPPSVETKEFYGTARRSFVAYRLALDGVHWAETADQTGLSERYLRDNLGNKVSPHQAKSFFSITPEHIQFPGQERSLKEIEPYVQNDLNSPLANERFTRMSSLTPPADLAAKTARPSSRQTRPLVGLDRELVDHFVNLATAIGVPRSYGEIYGILFASSEPLSFTDIQERTDLSKGSISLGLHALRAVGAIRPSPGSDHRRDHFVPETELRQLIAGLMKESLQMQIRGGTKRLAEMISRHRAVRSRSEHDKVLSSRLDKLQSWHRKASLAVPLISKLLA